MSNAEEVLEQQRKHESAKALVKLSMTADEIRKQVVEEEYEFARENSDYIREYISEYFKNETEILFSTLTQMRDETHSH